MAEILYLTHPVMPGFILALLLGLTIAFSWSPWSHILSHWRLHSLVNKLGKASLRNVYVPDGLGDDLYIEQLILQQDKLLLVTIKPFRGNIFAAEHIDLWTQVVGHHSYKFNNPLHQLQADLQVLQGKFPKLRVDGWVVFAKGCRFPKGKPDCVIAYENLKNSEQTANEISPAVQGAWDKLLAEAVPAKAMRQSILYRRGDKRRLVLGLIFAFGTLGYALWYLNVLPL
jgi:hypothetical protein